MLAVSAGWSTTQHTVTQIMRPKGKLFALVVLFAAVGLLTATGAFTTVEADRTAEINTAGDSNALVAIQAADENGEYLTQNGNEAEFDLGAPNSADGVNLNASTNINRTINITNNGGDPVNVHIEASGDNNGYVSFYANQTAGADTNITGAGNTVEVGSGNNVTVSVLIDTTDGDNSWSGEENLINEITIVAEDAS